MSRWFRHYAGMVRDDKLVRAAVKCGQPIERVVWVYGAILESAAEINDDGRYDFDAGEAAYFLRADEADISAIEASLESCGRLAEGRVVRWGDRQFKSDDSSERVRRYRNKQKGNGNGEDKQGSNKPERDGNADVTATKRRGNAPDTDTDTDTSSLRSDEARTSESTPSRKPSSRGTRIPDDYEPDLSEATARGASLQQAAEEAEKFRDWAIAAPGQKGVKLDWPATWRNWCRRADWKQTRGPPAKDGFAQVLNELNGTSHEPDHHDDNIIEAIATQPGFGANDGCDAERSDTGERGGHAPAGQGTETRRQAGA